MGTEGVRSGQAQAVDRTTLDRPGQLAALSRRHLIEDVAERQCFFIDGDLLPRRPATEVDALPVPVVHDDMQAAPSGVLAVVRGESLSNLGDGWTVSREVGDRSPSHA